MYNKTMAQITEERYKELAEKNRQELIYGLKNKLIFPFSDDLFDHLRPFCYGGLPLSIKLFITDWCNGQCYESALLMQLAFKDCKVIHADIESLRNLYPDDDPEHAFIETTDFGKPMIVDTSTGLIYDKEYYFKLEKPKINRVISKKQCMNSYTILSILASDFEKEKSILPLLLPNVELIIENSTYVSTTVYKDKLLRELQIFKEKIGYDAMRQEMEEDIILMHTNPQELDKKYKIERDRYGNEISKKGIKNPYYISPEDRMVLANAKKGTKEYVELAKKQQKKCLAIRKREFKDVLKLAKVRLRKILKNPTKNFYESEEYE